MSYEELWKPLTRLYDAREAKAIARLILEERFGLTMADVLCGKTGDDTVLRHIQQRLLQGEPVQYVLGVAEFGGRQFRVAPGVLIPRPETLELCQWVQEEGREERGEWRGITILDIGTGSGCIACTLAAELPEAQVTAWDISEVALAIAQENAQRLGVQMKFEKQDVLHPSPSTLHQWNIIVSNPPYVCEKERATMERHVLDYEPSLALFVPDDDPLLFYRAIADYARRSLTAGGSLFFEINPLYAGQLKSLLSAMSYHHIEVRDDQYGKPRMIKAQR